jgi:hypothetical protein
MPYSIDKYNGTTIAVVEDGTIDSTLDIKLIGKNYAGYGEVQNENFVHLLENFAGGSAPPRPISGQIWYDTTTKKIKFYDAASARWRTAGGAESTAGPTGPIGLGQGDFWFETINKQLYVYDGSAYVLVGPQGVGGLGTTQMKSVLVTDNIGGEHGIIQALVDGDIVFVVSTDSFTLSTASATTMPGFGIIKSGITLASTNNVDGITDVDVDSKPLDTVWGTVSNSLKLNGFTSNDFVLKSGTGIDFNVLVKFSDLGYTVGDSDDLEVKIDADGITPIFKTSINNTIKFQTYNSLTPTIPNTPLTLVGANILPGIDNVTNLGSSSFKFKDIFGTTFSGTAAQSDKLKVVGTTYADAAVASTADTVVVRTAAGAINATSFLGNASTATTAITATQADSLQVGGVYRTASVSEPNEGDANTIAVRDFAGDLCATIFRGTATAALFADLAEKYLADDEYEVGTVVTVGGEQEVTACQMGDRAFGAVSGSPAFMMNEGLVGGTYIALKGRVPVKVIGSVVKGDKLIAASNGCAGPARVLLQNLPVRAGNFPDTFAIALESSDDEGIKLIEAIII